MHARTAQKQKEVFADAKETYADIEQNLKTTASFSGYIPYLDTLKTSLQFLEQNQQLLNNAQAASGQLSTTLNKVKELESSLGKAEVLKAFINQRRAFLKELVWSVGFKLKFCNLTNQSPAYPITLLHLAGSENHWYAKIFAPAFQAFCFLPLYGSCRSEQSFLREDIGY